MTNRHRRSSLAAIFAFVTLVGAACSGGGSSTKASSAPTANETPANEPSAPEAAAPEAPAPEAAAPASDPAAAPAPAAPAPDQASGAAPATGAAKQGAAAVKPGTKGAGPTAGGAAPGASTPNPGQSKSAAPAPGAPTPGTPGAPVKKENYNSDVGVTKDTITLGTINLTSSVSGLGPIIGGPAEQTADAVTKYINANGGVAGRKLKILNCDDGGDVSRARACYEKLKGKVFAFIPSMTWLTDTIHDTLAKDKVPWLSWGWFQSEYKDRWMFPCHANGIREANALASWTVEKFKPKTVGIIYLNVTEDIVAKDEATKVLEAAGVKVVKTIPQEWDSPDESQHVLAMRSANPDVVLSFSWPTPVAKFMHDAAAQKWAPPMGYMANHVSGDPGAFGPVWGDYAKNRLYGITSWTTPGPKSDVNNPWSREQQQYFDERTRQNGGSNEFQGAKWRYGVWHHISQSTWACTKILADAAGKLGPDLTRTAFVDMLESRSWDTDLGVTVSFPKGDHYAFPYSFNREYVYAFVAAEDGGFDYKRILPDPIYRKDWEKPSGLPVDPVYLEEWKR